MSRSTMGKCDKHKHFGYFSCPGCEFAKLNAKDTEIADLKERVRELEEDVEYALSVPNPYPKTMFLMTIEEYVKAIPDPKLRTSISGLLMGDGWQVAMKQVKEALQSVKE